jgi:hypothetical protein
MNEEFNPQVYSLNNEEFNSFVKKLKEYEPEEIEKIILRYISYKPEMAEAALYVAVEKGLITYDLKEKMLEQIRLNYSGKSKYAKQSVWEKNNVFTGFVSRFSDDQIYEIIDNPSDIIIDAFHAVLIVARDRELISTDDFENLFRDSIENTRNDTEILKDEINEIFASTDKEEALLTDSEIEAYKSKYWKCPSCHELVDENMDICWNCQTGKPEIVEHPDKQEIIRELQPVRSFNPYKTGMTLIVCGTGLFVISFFRGYSSSVPWTHRYFTMAFSALFIISGLFIAVTGFTDKSGKK